MKQPGIEGPKQEAGNILRKIAESSNKEEEEQRCESKAGSPNN